MQQFTALQYLCIALVNAYGNGQDKLTWMERIIASDKILNHEDPESLAESADEPHLFLKTLRAIDDYHTQTPSGYIMPLDATASGLQIMAVLLGCKTTAEKVNLIPTGKREDAYQNIADSLERTRAEVKKPVMT